MMAAERTLRVEGVYSHNDWLNEQPVLDSMTRLLPDYASYLRQHHLRELYEDQLRIVDTMDIPLMRFFKHLSREELIQMGMAGLDLQLQKFEEGKEMEYLEESLENWRNGSLGFDIPREAVHPSDLILIYSTSQQSLNHFVGRYTQDVNTALQLVDEINQYYTKASERAFEVLNDIREEAAQALRDSEHQFRSLTQSAFDGIMVSDKACRILFVNESMTRIFGYSEGELLEMDVDDLVDTEWLAELKRILGDLDKEAKETGMARLTDVNGRTKNGEDVPVDIAISTWPTRKGRYYSFILHDISELKHTANELESKARQLTDSNTELEQFAYIASHDLREPLRTVSNFVQLMGRQVNKEDSRMKEFMGHIMDGTRRMDKLINDLLDYSRISRQAQAFETLDLNTILEEVRTNLSEQIKNQNARIEAEPLPKISADPTQMVQLFQNLASNGMKFNKSGQPTITITAKPEKDMWHIVVADNGIGIPEEYSEKVFAMFQRVHTEYRGTGIGLAICKRIVERHGGTIWFESKEGQGTKFHFTLPKA